MGAPCCCDGDRSSSRTTGGPQLDHTGSAAGLSTSTAGSSGSTRGRVHSWNYSSTSPLAMPASHLLPTCTTRWPSVGLALPAHPQCWLKWLPPSFAQLSTVLIALSRVRNSLCSGKQQHHTLCAEYCVPGVPTLCITPSHVAHDRCRCCGGLWCPHRRLAGRAAGVCQGGWR